MADIWIIMPYSEWYIDQSSLFAPSSWKKHQHLKAYLKLLAPTRSFSCGDQAHAAQMCQKTEKPSLYLPVAAQVLKKPDEITDW